MSLCKVLVTVLCLCNFANSDENCPDRAALNKVDVRVHSASGSRARFVSSVNINELDEDIRMIDVTKANVSVLCDGMVKIFPRLEYLTLINTNLSSIQPEAFHQVPKLKVLSFAVNSLTRVKRSQLKNLPSLESLSFAANKINAIDSDSFHDLPNLKKIYLDRNELYEISPEWFLKNSKLSFIDLSFNGISKLQDSAFHLLKLDGIVEISLKSNRIEEIDNHPVKFRKSEDEEMLPYLVLHLERNKMKSIPFGFLKGLEDFHASLVLNNNLIECIPQEVLNHMKVSTTNLTVLSNPISCDCLEKVDYFVAVNDVRPGFVYNNSFSCDNIQPSFI